MTQRQVPDKCDCDAGLPWWQRVLERQGFATLFALFACYVGFDLAQAHKDYLVKTTAAVERLTDFSSTVGEAHTRMQVQLTEMRTEQQKTGAAVLECLKELSASQKKRGGLPLSSKERERIEQIIRELRGLPSADEIDRAIRDWSDQQARPPVR